ncbi:Las1-like-domain-containing protein [Chaetomium tenue]|uniref:Las1-like-domain-containing protein n=1 Tax=Chaetomium tenue TaxID=1854479 RepID=A0ACB7PDF2_9PEZI|nr:Las1-like-domain-containing protein [Chaetomium globosum]
MVQYIFTPWRNRHELLAVRAQFYPEHHHHEHARGPQTPQTPSQSKPQTRLRSRPWSQTQSQPPSQSQSQSQSQTQAQSHPSGTAATAAAKQQAVAHVSMWMHRGGCPHMVESTALLMAAMLSDEGYGFGNRNESGKGKEGGFGDGGGGGGRGAAAASRAYAVRAAYSAAFSRFVTGLLDSHQDKQRKMSMYDVAKSVGLPATFVELRHQATHEQLPSLPRLRAAAASALQWIWEYYWRGLEEEDGEGGEVEVEEEEEVEGEREFGRLPLSRPVPAAAVGGGQPTRVGTGRTGPAAAAPSLQRTKGGRVRAEREGQGAGMATEVSGGEAELQVLLGRYLEGGEEDLKGQIGKFSEGLVLSVLDSISGSTRDSTVMRRALALQRDILLNGMGGDRMEEDEVPGKQGSSDVEVDEVEGRVVMEDEEDIEEGEVAGLDAVSGGGLGAEAYWGGLGGIACAAAIICSSTAHPKHVRLHCCKTSLPKQILFINCQRVGKSDNYAYIVVDEKSKEAVVIDPAHPAEVAPVLKKAIQDGSIKLTAIINTHHHWDHAGGNEELLSELGQPLEIIGGKDCKKVTKTPPHGATFNIGDIAVKALHTPCHTQDSICFFMQDGNDKVVFTGDTLFHGGCGRFFEGNGEEMHKALNVTLGSLPDDTRVFYTGANAKFGVSVLPSGAVKALQSFAEDNKETQGKFTIGDEKNHNVFMRPQVRKPGEHWRLWRLTPRQDPEIQKATGETDPIAIMTKLREMKNNFK